jgi:hypothetical protein
LSRKQQRHGSSKRASTFAAIRADVVNIRVVRQRAAESDRSRREHRATAGVSEHRARRAVSAVAGVWRWPPRAPARNRMFDRSRRACRGDSRSTLHRSISWVTAPCPRLPYAPKTRPRWPGTRSRRADRPAGPPAAVIPTGERHEADARACWAAAEAAPAALTREREHSPGCEFHTSPRSVRRSSRSPGCRDERDASRTCCRLYQPAATREDARVREHPRRIRDACR